MKVAHIFRMYSEGECLAPLSDNVKATKKPDKDFSEEIFKKILASLVYGKGMLISDICKATKLGQGVVRSHCGRMRAKGRVVGRKIDENKTYGFWTYYLVGDPSIPLTQSEINENLTLELIAKESGILLADIQRKLKLTQYAARKATRALEKKGLVKCKNIAKTSDGGRKIHSWVLIKRDEK